MLLIDQEITLVDNFVRISKNWLVTDLGWMLTEKTETMASKNFFYILVNLESETGLPEFHIVPSSVITKEISKSHSDWLAAP